MTRLEGILSMAKDTCSLISVNKAISKHITKAYTTCQKFIPTKWTGLKSAGWLDHLFKLKFPQVFRIKIGVTLKWASNIGNSSILPKLCKLCEQKRRFKLKH